MGRQTVYAYDGPLVGDQRRAGWFDPGTATAYDEGSWWNASYGTTISRATGSPSVHERLYHTAEGRWVLHWWAQWQGRLDRWSFATDGYARDWLLANGHDAAVEEHFGTIEPKRGPGRPPIGRPIQVRLPDGLLARLDAFAGELRRAEAVRILLDAALVNAEQVDPGSTHGDRR
jgi:hypothetical protein